MFRTRSKNRLRGERTPQIAAPREENGKLAAKSAALRYVSDSQPGIQRRRAGRGFAYIDPDGRRIKDADTLARIRSLAIPPAWTKVWICPNPQGHIQATGRDARGRKQYRYHPRWFEVRDETKYNRMLEFAAVLPRIRRRVQRDLAQTGIPRTKVLAILVRLLETTGIRVGNEEYARANSSYGLTTFQNRHARVRGATVEFRFRGKSGILHTIELSDKRLARLVKRVQELPGQELFQYRDDAGVPQPIDSADVNEYLREISQNDFTAKDFRTWNGTLAAAIALRALGPRPSTKQAKRAIVDAIRAVAHELGNTVAVCRKCYVHPAVIDAYQSGVLAEWMTCECTLNGRSASRLKAEEAALVAVLTKSASAK